MSNNGNFLDIIECCIELQQLHQKVKNIVSIDISSPPNASKYCDIISIARNRCKFEGQDVMSCCNVVNALLSPNLLSRSGNNAPKHMLVKTIKLKAVVIAIGKGCSKE